MKDQSLSQKPHILIVDDEEFNEIKYDYRGNPLYSTMISKLCNYNHRSEFILKVLKNELEINNDGMYELSDKLYPLLFDLKATKN